jgi:hypothetical protein
MPTKAVTGNQPVYSPPPSFKMIESVVANFPSKTGKTLEQWIAIVKKSGPASDKERRAWLKEKHGLTTNYAMFVVEQAAGRGGAENYDPEALVDAIFSGQKSELRPVYEQILRFGLSLGNDVRVCPCATIVPFYRQHVFAQVKVPNRSRIDLGFALGDLKPVGLLIETGGFAKKDRITHRIEIAKPEQFNNEAKEWFRRAYEKDAR